MGDWEYRRERAWECRSREIIIELSSDAQPGFTGLSRFQLLESAIEDMRPNMGACCLVMNCAESGIRC